jgi:hypothetical protein
MRRSTLFAFIVLAAAALQACGSINLGTPCTDQQKASCRPQDMYCSTRTDCQIQGANVPGPQPGVISKLGQCANQTARLVMPPPYFTTRTTAANGSEVATPNPARCQPFDVVWNACNAGSVTSTATNYSVTLTEQIPSGGNPGLNFTQVITAPALAPCACSSATFVSSTGLHCNDPAFIPRPTTITTSLPSATASPATGTFTIGL